MPKTKQNPQNLPGIDIDVRECEDGTVLATLRQCPIGDIYARNMQALQDGMVYLMKTLIEQEKKRMMSGNSQGAFGNGMQGIWIEGEFVVRWLPVAGFGVSFPSEQALGTWLKELLKVAIKAARV